MTTDGNEQSSVDWTAILESLNSINRGPWHRFWSKFKRKSKASPKPVASLDDFDTLRYRWLDQRLALRSDYSRWFKWLLTIQVLLADIGFVWYAFAIHWQIPATAMSAWLGSVVAQVITIVITITRGIFPAGESADHGKPHDNQTSPPASDD